MTRLFCTRASVTSISDSLNTSKLFNKLKQRTKVHNISVEVTTGVRRWGKASGFGTRQVGYLVLPFFW